MYRRVALWIVSGVLIVFGAILTYQFTNEFFLSNGYFKGTHNDFLAFWATGKLVAEGNIGQVYSADALTAIQRTVVPHPVSMLGYMPFLNPPFVAVLLAPLGVLSVNDARLAWMVLSVIVMVAISWFLTRSIQNKWTRTLCIFLIASSYPVFQNLIQGQLSILLTAAILAGIYMAERGKLFYSGLFLSALVVKPQLAVFVGIALLAFRQWTVIKGMIVGTLALLIVTLPFTGIDIYRDYVQFASGVTSGHFTGAGTIDRTTWQGDMKYMYSLLGLAVAIFGQGNIVMTNLFVWGVGAILIVIYIFHIRYVRPSLSTNEGRVALSKAMAIMLLLNPHAYPHDVVLIVPLLYILYLGDKENLKLILPIVGLSTLTYIDMRFYSHLITALLLLFAACPARCYKMAVGTRDG